MRRYTPGSTLRMAAFCVVITCAPLALMVFAAFLCNQAVNPIPALSDLHMVEGQVEKVSISAGARESKAEQGLPSPAPMARKLSRNSYHRLPSIWIRKVYFEENSKLSETKSG